MYQDRYGNRLDVTSAQSRDAYVAAVDNLLGAQVAMNDIAGSFATITESEPGFALGHSGLARASQLAGNMPAARAASERALHLVQGGSAQDKSHVAAMDLLIAGKGAQAHEAIRKHVAEHPRDVMIAQTCTSVFGLIGFSGRPGREAELLAYTTALEPYYGDDWWFLSQHAFSHCETGMTDQAVALVDRSLAQNDRNAHAVHVRSHAYYEAGETDAGRSYLNDWVTGYDRGALMHGHLSWHAALWALEQGDTDEMWARVDTDVVPGAAAGLSINVLTDTASILYRAELMGETIDPARWQQVSAYAAKCFPNPGLAFVDMHAALAHAMAGNVEDLARIMTHPAGPAADLVQACAEGFEAIARQDWACAVAHLTRAGVDHARLGGSRAQRDLIDFALVSALLRVGHEDEARRLLLLRRPILADKPAIKGL